MSITALLGFVLLGITGTVNGTALPFLVDKFSLSLSMAGMLLSINSSGYMLASISLPRIASKITTKRILTIGTLILGVSLLLLPTSPIWIGVLFATFWAGFGASTIDVSLNALVSEIPGKQGNSAMNLLHFAYGVGALGGPLLFSIVLAKTSTWPLIYWFSGSIILILVRFFATHNFAVNSDPAGTVNTGSNANTKLYQTSTFWLLIATMFIYCGIEGALLGWVTTFITSEFAISADQATISITVLWVGITIGRGLASKFGYLCSTKTLLLVLYTGTTVMLVVTAVVISEIMAFVGLFLTGLFLSSIFPMLMLHGTALFPTMRIRVSGGLVTAASVGGIAVPAILGFTGEILNLRWGILVLAVLSFIAIGLVALLPPPTVDPVIIPSQEIRKE